MGVDWYCDGSWEGRPVPPALAGTTQLRASVGISSWVSSIESRMVGRVITLLDTCRSSRLNHPRNQNVKGTFSRDGFGFLGHAS